MEAIPFDELLKPLRAPMKDVLERAYRAGFEAGGNAMRENILRAVNNPFQAEAPPVPPPTDSAAVRAPRGAVGAAVESILRDHPLLRITDIEDVAANEFPLVATKSLGNELRRGEGKKYKRDDEGRWSLL